MIYSIFIWLLAIFIFVMAGLNIYYQFKADKNNEFK